MEIKHILKHKRYFDDGNNYIEVPRLYYIIYPIIKFFGYEVVLQGNINTHKIYKISVRKSGD